jgi:hypothetical protein
MAAIDPVGMKGVALRDYYVSGVAATPGAIYRADASGNISNVKTGVAGVALDHVPILVNSGCVLATQSAWE